ncbi:MAG TPA: hypothetical protein VFO39_14880 [Candidatus Sulfotelmatobacter sp.]|nr:hypothetical protein [Candidatus Sulfotelmatobacter sp.]
MRLISVLLLAGSTAVLPQVVPSKRATAERHALKAFVSPDGTFSFNYPDLLNRCEQKLQRTGEGYYWTPDTCAGFSGVCDVALDPNYVTLACFAYPRNEFTDTPAFEAAAFSVSIIEKLSEKECLEGSRNWTIVRRAKTATIQGRQFKLFETEGAATSHGMRTEVYRTVHDGRCYQLATAVAVTNPDVFDPPARKLTELDRNEVNGRLKQALESFRFLR